MSGERSIVKYMGIFSGMQIVNILCSVARAKLIALWIGPAGTGLFALLNSAVDMVAGATQMNLRQASVRDLSHAGARAFSQKVSAVRWWARNLGLLGALVIALGSPLLSIVSFGDWSHWWAFAALSVVVYSLSVIAGEQAVMQGSGALKSLASSMAVGAVAGTIASAPVIWLLGESGIVPSIIVIVLCAFVSALAHRHARVPSLSWRSNFSLGREFMRLGVAMSVASLAVSLGNYAFLSYLNQKSGASATGCYQAGYSMVVRYVGLVFTALAMEYYPRLSRIGIRPSMMSKAVSRQLSLLMCILCPLLIVFVSACGVLLRMLYSDEFYGALPYLTIGIGGAALQGVSYCQSYVMLARGDMRAFVITDLLSAVIGLCLNISLYNMAGMAGLGVAYVVWQACYLVIVGIVYRSRYGMTLSKKAIFVSASACATVFAAIGLKAVGWWAPLLMLIPATALAFAARRKMV